MINALRKTAKALLLALILATAVLPSAALMLAPAPVHAQASGTPAPTSSAASTTGNAKDGDVQRNWLTNIVIEGTQAIVQMLVGMLGKLTLQLIHILIMVASYNDYMNAKAVTTGWVIVRDIANLFIVAVILVISIGSIVKPGKFGGPKEVFYTLLYALFVNFSRTITAFFIDISQLVMLTFVNGFAAAAGGNFVEALGITKLTDIQPGGSALTFGSVMGGLFLALIMFVIITVVIAVMVVAMVVRMVTLWMLVVISPAAFAMAPYKSTHEHYAKWWKELEKNLTTGPIVAFFLWLALASFQGSTGSDIVGKDGLKENAAAKSETTSVSCGDTVACSEDNMIRFIISTAMLLMGLSFAQQFGSVGGAMAASASKMGKDYARKAVSYVGRKSAMPIASVATGGVLGGAGYAAGYLAKNTRWGQQATNRVRAGIGRTLGGGNAVGNIAGRIPGIGYLGRSITAGASKKREELMADVRKNLAGINDSQRMILFRSSTQAPVVKDVIAADIAKNKTYSKAKFDDPKEKKNYGVFVEAYKRLDAAAKSGDKPSGDAVKDIKESRPDIVAAASGKSSDLTGAAASASRDDLKKVNFELMGRDNRNAYFGAVGESVLNDFYDKVANSQVRGYIDQYRSGSAKQGKELQDGIKSGMDVSSQPAKIYNPANNTYTPNIDLAVNTIALGNAAQLKGLKSKSDEDKRMLSQAVSEGLRKSVDFNSGAGLSGTGASQRMSDENLRRAEAAVILGADAVEHYKLKNDGSFSGKASENSFAQSVGPSSPHRLEFVLSLKGAALKGDASRKIYDSLNPDDLDAMAKLAQTPDEKKALESVVKEAIRHAQDDINVPGAAGSVSKFKAYKTMRRVAANPDLNRLT